MDFEGGKMVLFPQGRNSLNVRLENLNDRYDNQNETQYVDLIALANHLYI